MKSIREFVVAINIEIEGHISHRSSKYLIHKIIVQRVKYWVIKPPDLNKMKT